MRFTVLALLIAITSCLCTQAAEKPVEVPLSVRDEATGIAVSAKEGRQVIVAKDKDGKTLWEADVIEKAGKPAVGDSVIRHLALEKGQVSVTYGKHSFAKFDLKTGKLMSAGSD